MATWVIAFILAGQLCGSERRDVKMMQDAAAAQVAQITPIKATVEDLLRLKAPRYRERAPRSAAESKVHVIEADVLGYKLEADGDIHVVIRGKPGHAMVVELPAPECSAKSPAADDMAKARAAFVKQIGTPRKTYRRLPKPIRARITGVVYMDKVHGQLGVAKNGVELHPVLAFELVGP